MPYVGDSKRALDEYTSELMLGGTNTLVLHNTCEVRWGPSRQEAGLPTGPAHLLTLRPDPPSPPRTPFWRRPSCWTWCC